MSSRSRPASHWTWSRVPKRGNSCQVAANVPQHSCGQWNRRQTARNRDRAQSFLITTANTSWWSKASDYLLGCGSDVVLLQETKSQPADIKAFRWKAYSAGYSFMESNAIGDKRISLSCGVMVAWKRHLRVNNEPVVTPTERFVDVTLSTSVLGEIVLGSIYLHQGAGIQQGGLNDALLLSVFPPLKMPALAAS